MQVWLILLLLLLFPHGDSSDLNSAAEVDNWPALRDSILPRPKEDKTSELYPLQDMSMTCTLQSQEIMGWLELVQPTQFPIYGGICISAQGGTPTVYIAVKHEAYCELQLVDAVVS